MRFVVSEEKNGSKCRCVRSVILEFAKIARYTSLNSIVLNSLMHCRQLPFSVFQKTLKKKKEKKYRTQYAPSGA